jgi:hypothetical protein
MTTMRSWFLVLGSWFLVAGSCLAAPPNQEQGTRNSSPELRRDAAAVAGAVPAVRRIVLTSYGFRLDTASGPSFVHRTSYGYRVDGGPAAGTLFYRNPTGFTVQTVEARSRLR